jgi:hypothetical protein
MLCKAKKQFSLDMSNKFVNSVLVSNVRYILSSFAMFSVKLVNYSSSSDSEGSEDIPLARLRQKLITGNGVEQILSGALQEFTRKGEVRKRKSYEKSMKERQEETNRKKLHHYGVKEGCKNCKKECNLNFDKARRLELNTRYWNMNWQERQIYVSSNVTACLIRKRRGTDESKRQKSLRYFLKTETGSRIQVCKVFFLTTLGYHKKMIELFQTTWEKIFFMK